MRVGSWRIVQIGYRQAGLYCRGGSGGFDPPSQKADPSSSKSQNGLGVDYNPPANPLLFTMYHFAYGDDPT